MAERGMILGSLTPEQQRRLQAIMNNEVVESPATLAQRRRFQTEESFALRLQRQSEIDRQIREQQEYDSYSGVWRALYYMRKPFDLSKNIVAQTVMPVLQLGAIGADVATNLFGGGDENDATYLDIVNAMQRDVTTGSQVADTALQIGGILAVSAATAGAGGAKLAGTSAALRAGTLAQRAAKVSNAAKVQALKRAPALGRVLAPSRVPTVQQAAASIASRVAAAGVGTPLVAGDVYSNVYQYMVYDGYPQEAARDAAAKAAILSLPVGAVSSALYAGIPAGAPSALSMVLAGATAASIQDIAQQYIETTVSGAPYDPLRALFVSGIGAAGGGVGALLLRGRPEGGPQPPPPPPAGPTPPQGGPPAPSPNAPVPPPSPTAGPLGASPDANVPPRYAYHGILPNSESHRQKLLMSGWVELTDPEGVKRLYAPPSLAMAPVRFNNLVSARDVEGHRLLTFASKVDERQREFLTALGYEEVPSPYKSLQRFARKTEDQFSAELLAKFQAEAEAELSTMRGEDAKLVIIGRRDIERNKVLYQRHEIDPSFMVPGASYMDVVVTPKTALRQMRRMFVGEVPDWYVRLSKMVAAAGYTMDDLAATMPVSFHGSLRAPYSVIERVLSISRNFRGDAQALEAEAKRLYASSITIDALMRSHPPKVWLPQHVRDARRAAHKAAFDKRKAAAAKAAARAAAKAARAARAAARAAQGQQSAQGNQGTPPTGTGQTPSGQTAGQGATTPTPNAGTTTSGQTGQGASSPPTASAPTPPTPPPPSAGTTTSGQTGQGVTPTPPTPTPTTPKSVQLDVIQPPPGTLLYRRMKLNILHDQSDPPNIPPNTQADSGQTTTNTGQPPTTPTPPADTGQTQADNTGLSVVDDKARNDALAAINQGAERNQTETPATTPSPDEPAPPATPSPEEPVTATTRDADVDEDGTSPTPSPDDVAQAAEGDGELVTAGDDEVIDISAAIVPPSKQMTPFVLSPPTPEAIYARDMGTDSERVVYGGEAYTVLALDKPIKLLRGVIDASTLVRPQDTPSEVPPDIFTAPPVLTRGLVPLDDSIRQMAAAYVANFDKYASEAARYTQSLNPLYNGMSMPMPVSVLLTDIPEQEFDKYKALLLQRNLPKIEGDVYVGGSEAPNPAELTIEALRNEFGLLPETATTEQLNEYYDKVSKLPPEEVGGIYDEQANLEVIGDVIGVASDLASKAAFKPGRAAETKDIEVVGNLLETLFPIVEQYLPAKDVGTLTSAIERWRPPEKALAAAKKRLAEVEAEIAELNKTKPTADDSETRALRKEIAALEADLEKVERELPIQEKVVANAQGREQLEAARKRYDDLEYEQLSLYSKIREAEARLAARQSVAENYNRRMASLEALRNEYKIKVDAIEKRGSVVAGISLDNASRYLAYFAEPLSYALSAPGSSPTFGMRLHVEFTKDIIDSLRLREIFVDVQGKRYAEKASVPQGVVVGTQKVWFPSDSRVLAIYPNVLDYVSANLEETQARLLAHFRYPENVRVMGARFSLYPKMRQLALDLLSDQARLRVALSEAELFHDAARAIESRFADTSAQGVVQDLVDLFDEAARVRAAGKWLNRPGKPHWLVDLNPQEPLRAGVDDPEMMASAMRALSKRVSNASDETVALADLETVLAGEEAADKTDYNAAAKAMKILHAVVPDDEVSDWTRLIAFLDASQYIAATPGETPLPRSPVAYGFREEALKAVRRYIAQLHGIDYEDVDPRVAELAMRDAAKRKEPLPEALTERIYRAIRRAIPYDIRRMFRKMREEAKQRKLDMEALAEVYQKALHGGDSKLAKAIDKEFRDIAAKVLPKYVVESLENRPVRWQAFNRYLGVEFMLANRMRETATALLPPDVSAVPMRAYGTAEVKQLLADGISAGTVRKETGQLLLWAIEQAPHLADDVGLVLGETGVPRVRSLVDWRDVSGAYDRAERIIYLFGKERQNVADGVHELAHHVYDLLPVDVQAAVRREFERRSQRLSPEQRQMQEDVRNGRRMVMGDVVQAVRDGRLPYDMVSEREFFAARLSELLARRYESATSPFRRLYQWILEFTQRVRYVLGLSSDRPIIKAWEELIAGKRLVDRPKPEDLTVDLMVAGTDDSKHVRIRLPTMVERAVDNLRWALDRREKETFKEWLKRRVASLSPKYMPDQYRVGVRTRLRQLFVDDAAALANLEWAVHGKAAMTNPAISPVIRRALANGVPAQVMEQLNHGLEHYGTRQKFVGTAGDPMNINYLTQYIKRGTDEEVEQDLLMLSKYMFHARTLELAQRWQRTKDISGFGQYHPSGDDVVAATEFMASLDAATAARAELFARAYREMAMANTYRLVEGGYITEAVYRRIWDKNKYYVSFQRVEDFASPEVLINVKGSDKPLDNPIVSLMRDIYKVDATLAKNDLKRSVVDLINDTTTKDAGQLLVGFKPSGKLPRNVIMVRRDGKSEYWKLDKHLYNAVEGYFDLPDTVHKFADVLSFFGRAQRAAIAMSPRFVFNNVVRDFAERLVSSSATTTLQDVVTSTKGIGNFVEHVRAIERWGGGNSTLMTYQVTSAHKMFAKHLRDLMHEKNTVLLYAGKAPRAWMRAVELSEMVSRVQEYEAGLAEAKRLGLSNIEAQQYAAYKARSYLDYARMGMWLRFINKFFYMPFANAAVQGVARDLRLMMQRPGTVGARFALFMMLPALAYEAYKRHGMSEQDRERLRQLPGWRRDLFWNFPVGELIITVPRPHVWGSALGLFERTVESHADGNKAFDGYLKTLATSLLPPIPFVASPVPGVTEAATNYSLFFDRYIVPPQDVNVDPRLRDFERASSLSQLVARVASDAGIWLDPRSIDHFLVSQFGQWARVGLATTTAMLEDRPSEWRDVLLATSVYTTVPAGVGARDIERALRLAVATRDDQAVHVGTIRALLMESHREPTLAGRNAKIETAYAVAAQLNELYDELYPLILEYRAAMQDANSIAANYARLRYDQRQEFERKYIDGLRMAQQMRKYSDIIAQLRRQHLEAYNDPALRRQIIDRLRYYYTNVIALARHESLPPEPVR